MCTPSTETGGEHEQDLAAIEDRIPPPVPRRGVRALTYPSRSPSRRGGDRDDQHVVPYNPDDADAARPTRHPSRDTAHPADRRARAPHDKKRRDRSRRRQATRPDRRTRDACDSDCSHDSATGVASRSPSPRRGQSRDTPRRHANPARTDHMTAERKLDIALEERAAGRRRPSREEHRYMTERPDRNLGRLANSPAPPADLHKATVGEFAIVASPPAAGSLVPNTLGVKLTLEKDFDFNCKS